MSNQNPAALKSRSMFANGIDAKDVLNGRLDDATVRQAVEGADEL
jgi:hypothetical protein